MFPSTSSSSPVACGTAVTVADELRAVLGPAGELARHLAGATPTHRPEYPRLLELAGTLDFASAVLSQALTGLQEDHERWRAFSVDAMAREILPTLRASVQDKAKVTLTEDSHSPLLHGNPLALKRALLHVVRSLADTIAVPHGVIDVGVTLITFGDGALAGDAFRAIPPRRMVRLTVADNGIGMDSGRIHALLQNNAGREDAGLQLACSIVKAHGGLLDIESHSGLGTMVRIDLPVVWPGRPPAAAVFEDPADSALEAAP